MFGRIWRFLDLPCQLVKVQIHLSEGWWIRWLLHHRAHPTLYQSNQVDSPAKAPKWYGSRSHRRTIVTLISRQCSHVLQTSWWMNTMMLHWMRSLVLQSILNLAHLWNLTLPINILKMIQFEAMMFLNWHKFLSYSYTTSKFKAQKGVPALVIPDVLHPTLGNGQMFFVKARQRRVLEVAAVDRNGSKTARYALHCIDFRFHTTATKSRTCSFHFVLHLLDLCRKGQEKHWKSL